MDCIVPNVLKKVDTCMLLKEYEMAIIEILYNFYKDSIKCTQIRTWYGYNDSMRLWMRYESTCPLRPADCEPLLRSRAESLRATSSSEAELAHHYEKAIQKLDSISFFHRLERLARHVFRDDGFEEHLDAAAGMLIFPNQLIYDFSKGVLRQIEMGDYISNHCPYALPYTVHPQITAESGNGSSQGDIQKYLKSILPNKVVRDYLLTVLGCLLGGRSDTRRIIVLSGRGCNGITTFINFLYETFGAYMFQLPWDIFYRKDFNKFDHQILQNHKGSRLAVMRAVGDINKPFQTSKVHQLLLDYPHISLLVYGHDVSLPSIAKEDSIWDLIDVISFDIDINKRRVPDMLSQLRSLSPSFLWLILQHHAQGQSGELIPPVEVREATARYRLKEYAMF